MNTEDTDILNRKYKEDFNRALNIYENDYSHKDLINFIENGSVVEKQISILKLDKINSKKEADILISNLTGCDGKIREAVSFRLKEFTSENPQYYIEYRDIFLNAIVDINGNICRNTISALRALKPFEEFNKKFCSDLCFLTLILARKVKDFDIQEGKYKVNKEIFKLYWYLETIYEFAEFIETDILEDILKTSKEVKEYTIREKTAKILSKINKFSSIREELKNDENYYVRLNT